MAMRVVLISALLFYWQPLAIAEFDPSLEMEAGAQPEYPIQYQQGQYQGAPEGVYDATPVEEQVPAPGEVPAEEVAPVQSPEQMVQSQGKKLICQSEELACVTNCDSAHLLLSSYCNYFSEDEKVKCIANADFSTSYCKAGCGYVGKDCAEPR